MSGLYPFEIWNATSDKIDGLKEQHDAAVLEMTKKVAAEIFNGLTMANAATLKRQAALFGKILATRLRHIPARRLGEIEKPLCDAALCQLAVNMDRRPSVHAMICDVSILVAMPGAWSFNDMTGECSTKFSRMRGTDALAHGLYESDFLYSQSTQWLEWAIGGFKKLELGPQVGDEWDDWTPPSTRIKNLWEALPEAKREKACKLVLQYLGQGIKIGEKLDAQWKKTEGWKG